MDRHSGFAAFQALRLPSQRFQRRHAAAARFSVKSCQQIRSIRRAVAMMAVVHPIYCVAEFMGEICANLRADQTRGSGSEECFSIHLELSTI